MCNHTDMIIHKTTQALTRSHKMPLDFKGLALVAFGSVASTVLLTGTAQAQMAANANY